MLQFTAIDFETANTDANSACSLAAVSVSGTEIHERYTLIKPPFPTFAAENIRIHGITPEMVAHKAKFNVLWPAIKKCLDGRILVAHYAVFDTRVLRSLIKTYNLDGINASYVCSVELSRKIWPHLRNHKLDTVVNYLGYTFRHHQALDDARACALIIKTAAEKMGAVSMEDLLDRSGLVLKRF